ncbi:MAG: DUF521 domain-containing protein [Candidatus Korarchaeota archaeon]|nr:DUF521 domain-containing protein [Candidatus Korarchaeota archaeon]NIU82046.1 DUF521 domain-containing protein [Candidatus Thorarchaeota archaeon]NIW12465.1 DUF521 domain-containing protein [Candidatus Thorarchaeota archaeon]NIW50680.1 DUF521 domain-containing protein [Candidatus Korarchaeota archaeon]
MYLTRKEEEILDGKQGEAREIAMSILVKLGEMYDAEKMIEIENVHIDAASYATIYDAGLDFCEKLSELEASFRVPATLNTAAIDFEKWQQLGLPHALVEKQKRLANAYRAMGGIPTWTCTPYQYGAHLHYGQTIAWGESNAVVYANSVIGARTNRFGDLVDVCAALIGRVPKFGLYLNENRRGEVLINLNQLSLPSFTRTDYALLGYFVGSVTENLIPVLTNVPSTVTSDQLKAFGAALATSSSVALYHMCGVTPEASNKGVALGDAPPRETITVNRETLTSIKDKLSTTGDETGDLIALGCPHYSVEELRVVTKLMNGQKIKKDTEVWIFTSRMAKRLAEEMGLIDVIERSGGMVIADACPLYFPLDERGFRILMTDSAKMAYYAQGLTEMEVLFKPTEECVKSALDSRM